MEATRARFESFIEWAVALAFSVAAVAVGMVVLREFRTVSAVTRVIARETAPPPAAPPGVPSRAVSVPVLLLADGTQVRVGDSLTTIAARLGRQAEVGVQSIDETPQGERLTRFYDRAGTQFVLVFEAFEHGGERRVAAIYLQ